jgi:hypothetical protein
MGESFSAEYGAVEMNPNAEQLKALITEALTEKEVEFTVEVPESDSYIHNERRYFPEFVTFQQRLVLEDIEDQTWIDISKALLAYIWNPDLQGHVVICLKEPEYKTEGTDLLIFIRASCTIHS